MIFAAPLFLLPPLVYYLWACAAFYKGALFLPMSAADLRAFLAHMPGLTLAGCALYGAWVGLQLLLQLYGPGKVVNGTPLADGSRLPYKLNGWFSFWFTLGLLSFLCVLGLLPATLLADHLGPLLTAATVFAFALSLYLYAHGRNDPQEGAREEPFFKGFFMGTALNPRDGRLDWKFFCESRPGLTLWLLIDLSLCAKQHALLGHVTTPMMLVCAFQFLYVADYFFHEEAILTTWDIRHENFGWMLCWGCLVFVPFVFSLQAQYLLHHGHELHPAAIVLLFAMNLCGYYIFRSSNLQKHQFRKAPQRPIWGKMPSYIRTARGSLLLTSGWWGLARHINYTGDLIMALCWSLPCGLSHPLPYFYFLYFAPLLLHREYRDNAHCARRYGDDWVEYCQKVRWRLLPGIY